MLHPIVGTSCLFPIYAWSTICGSRIKLAGFLSSCAHPAIEIKRYFCNID
ncbi:hypothetical protein [Mesorhizobium waimense]|nr:hypothetical protein [Mesorhizobium waimense]